MTAERMRPTAVLARWLLLVCALAGERADALRLDHIEVRYEDSRYHLYALVDLAAPREAVYAVLTDYGRLSRLNEQIVESRIVEHESPTVFLVMTRVRGCVVLVCRELTRVERVREDEPNELVSRTLPELSDVRYETAAWRFEDSETGTRLIYRLEVEPDVWIPIVGRGAVKRQLRRSFERTVGAVERLAGEVFAHP